jgi:predicted Zn-dependent protease
VQGFIRWLGPRRAWTLFWLIALTGTFSLMLQAVDAVENSWVIPVQNALLLVAVLGVTGVLVSRLDPIDQQPLLVSVGPLVLGFAIGLFLPRFMIWFVGAGVGWLAVSQLILRRNVRREYQQAIRHLRKSEYGQAIAIINELIKAEPGNSHHYRFRGDLYRLQGHPNKAIKDFKQIVKLEPESAVGYNGLAEIHLQQDELEQALDYARQAYEKDPDQWVMPYNLGMVEDRLGMAAEAVEHLQAALTASVPDARHRVLIHLWLARNYTRLNQPAEASTHLETLRAQKKGLGEWQSIFESEQAQMIRRILAEDIDLAQQIFDGADADVFTRA